MRTQDDDFCEGCGGEGEVPRPGLTITQPFTMRCGYCNGTGYKREDDE